jgi:hypothetical protein
MKFYVIDMLVILCLGVVSNLKPLSEILDHREHKIEGEKDNIYK